MRGPLAFWSSVVALFVALWLAARHFSQPELMGAGASSDVESAEKGEPGRIAEALFAALNRGDYRRAARFHSAELRRWFEETGSEHSPADVEWAIEEMVRSQWVEHIRPGSIERTEVLREEIAGRSAKVLLRLHLQGGGTQDMEVPLGLEGAGWRAYSQAFSPRDFAVEAAGGRLSTGPEFVVATAKVPAELLDGPRPDMSPAQVLVAACLAANAWKFEAANRYISPEFVERMEAQVGSGFTSGSVMQSWRHLTNDGALRRIEAVATEYHDDAHSSATVHLRLHYADGSIATNHRPLVHTPEGWRIAAM